MIARGLVCFCVLFGICLCSQSAIASGSCVIVTGGEPEDVLAALPIEAGAPFSLRFINSIYLAPVEETYIYDPAKGIMTVRVESRPPASSSITAWRRTVRVLPSCAAKRARSESGPPITRTTC